MPMSTPGYDKARYGRSYAIHITASLR